MLAEFCVSLIWESEIPFLFIPDYFRYPGQFYCFQSPVLDLVKSAAADLWFSFDDNSYDFLITWKHCLFAAS